MRLVAGCRFEVSDAGFGDFNPFRHEISRLERRIAVNDTEHKRPEVWRNLDRLNLWWYLLLQLFDDLVCCRLNLIILVFLIGEIPFRPDT